MKQFSKLHKYCEPRCEKKAWKDFMRHKEYDMPVFRPCSKNNTEPFIGKPVLLKNSVIFSFVDFSKYVWSLFPLCIFITIAQTMDKSTAYTASPLVLFHTDLLLKHGVYNAGMIEWNDGLRFILKFGLDWFTDWWPLKLPAWAKHSVQLANA